MAIKYSTSSGTLIIPGSYVETQVQTSVSGTPTTGIIAIVGEAETGPRFSLEDDLEDGASFGPGQEGAVIAKYTSGPLVDAFRLAVNAANDPQIQGAPSRIVLVKTNLSTKASGALPKIGGGTYGTLYDKSYGKAGNLIYWRVTAATAESLPTTSSFTYIPAVGTVDLAIRSNGGAEVPLSLVANTAPNTFQSSVDGLAGVAATGGTNRNMVTVAGTLLLDANPGGAGATVIDLTRSVAWATTPTAGDTLVIPTGSVVAGAGDANVGAYVITSATASTLRATKLSDAGKAGAVVGVITNPVDVSPAVAIVAVTDAIAYAPITITQEAGVVVDGYGKSIAILQLTTGTDLLERTAYKLGLTTAVTWISKSGTPALINSTAEYRAQLAVTRQSDGVDEALVSGGEVALKVGYTGTTATLTVTDTTLTTSVTGGSGANLSVTLADFPTIADVVTFINAQTGYTASVGTAVLGLLPSSSLDNVAAVGCCTTFGSQPGRVKIDAYRFFQKIDEESVLVQLGNPAEQAASGLPDTTSAIAYLSGGAKGASANSDFSAALDGLKLVTCNFVVTAVSRDAASDIADGLTDASSTYTIDSVNASVKSHILAMSKLKAKKNRLAIVSKQDSFQNAKEAAANLATPRMCLAFQDFKNTDSAGNLTQFQPWAGAALAAGMQAAGFYRAIFNKGINTSGVLMADKSFDSRDTDQVEEALLAGLLPAKRADGGGFSWIADQTTYGKDSNFVFNSLQAMYALDVIALGTAQAMETAFVGQSVADVSAPVALASLDQIMSDWLRLKLIAPSSDAPRGYKNAKVSIVGPVMLVEASILLAGAIYFIPIKFTVSQVTQTAG